MEYRVELAERAARDLEYLYLAVDAGMSAQARAWFDRLEALFLSLGEQPARGARVPEDASLRQVLHGRKPHVYRVIYAVNEESRAVTVLHIRHGRRGPAAPDDTPFGR